jgi:predicted DNA-binding protein (MmcQ/YjbR family)
VVKVDGKVFAFLGHPESPPGLSVKLPKTCGEALLLPMCKPTGYGLGRGGWVTAAFQPDDTPPLDLLLRWLDESYRAVTKKKRIKELDSQTPA